MPEVTFTVSEEDRARLASRLGDDPNLVASIALLAFREWLNWIDANGRPGSITEQNTQRIFQIASTGAAAFDLDPASLSQTFDLPIGQARYLSNSIQYRYSALFRSNYLQMLHGVVSELEEECRLNRREGLIELRVPKVCEPFLVDHLRMIRFNDKDAIYPVRRFDFGKVVEYQVRVPDLGLLVRAIQNDLGTE